MRRKVRSSQCGGRWCDNHLFMMKNQSHQMNQDYNVSLRLCPKLNKSTQRFEGQLPILNSDGKHYTPLFILEQDQERYIRYDDSNRHHFENNQMLEEYEISQIMKPKVNHAVKFCKVCKVHFNDYQEHVDSSVHSQLIKNHPYSGFISELSVNFQLTKHQQKMDQELRHHITSSTLQSDEEIVVVDHQTSARLKESENIQTGL